MPKPTIPRVPGGSTRERRFAATVQEVVNSLIRRNDVIRITGENRWKIDQSGSQPLDSDLTAIAALTTTAFGRSFLTLANLAAAHALLELAGTTYTPTLTNVANLDGSTAYQCQYIRVGSTVSVSGKVDVDPTAAVATQLGISLPIASNFGAVEDCGGVAFASAIAGQGAAILGDAANNRAEMNWIAVDLTNQPMYFQFQYQIIP